MLINKTYTKASKKYIVTSHTIAMKISYMQKIITVLLYFKHLRVKIYKNA